jgi:hypothetical protein
VSEESNFEPSELDALYKIAYQLERLERTMTNMLMLMNQNSELPL